MTLCHLVRLYRWAPPVPGGHISTTTKATTPTLLSWAAARGAVLTTSTNPKPRLWKASVV